MTAGSGMIVATWSDRGFAMRAAFAVALLLSTAPALALECPSEAEVQAALQKYIETDFWSPSERETWKITDVSGFEFGPMKAGRIIQKQVEYGTGAQDVCPVRMEYSFKATKADGSVETTRKGVGETFFFYLDGFDEWTFKAGS